MSWLFQPAHSSMLLAGTGGFLDMHNPHVLSLLIADEFLPDKRNSYLPAVYCPPEIFLISRWPCPSKSSQLCSCQGGERDGVRMGSVAGS